MDGVTHVCAYVLNCNINLAPTGCASFVHDAHVMPCLVCRIKHTQ